MLLLVVHQSGQGFNGAALVKVRKQNHLLHVGRACCRFNGAALVKVRKLLKVVSAMPRPRWLQRGRTRESAEAQHVHVGVATTFGASTGPHS